MTIHRPTFHVIDACQPLVRQVGIDADTVFDDPRIIVWRDIVERQNCTLDETLPDGRTVRLHIKRFKSPRDRGAEAEVAGIRLLQERGIATVPLVGWGRGGGGRGFVISEDLAGYAAADKAVRDGLPLDRLIEPVAAVAGRLHRAGLHHRDLYLCHFFCKADGDAIDIHLIDAARVAELPRFFARRWIIKDVAQLLYSLRQVGATREQEDRLLAAYTAARGESMPRSMLRRIECRVSRIARHDTRLKRRQPGRDVSLHPLAGGTRGPVKSNSTDAC